MERVEWGRDCGELLVICVGHVSGAKREGLLSNAGVGEGRREIMGKVIL